MKVAHMDDSDTATIELSKSEAREVVNALSSYRTRQTGRDERRAMNVEEFLQREFDFKREDTGLTGDIGEEFASFLDGSSTDEHEVQLSRAEAEEAVAALSEHESESSTDAETVREIRNRFEEAFDLDARSGT